MNTMSENAENEIMCTCSGTTRGKIKILFEQGMDMDDISGWTGAISGCGGCEWDVAEFMKELAEQKSSL
jgi:bacterioferritin-associated ferredoxin